LLACAAREEEIASRVEALYPDAAAIQAAIRTKVPELEDINRTLFAGRSVRDQFAIQANGERLGAATWRSFATHEADPQRRAALLGCADLEEANATCLDSLRSA